LGDYPGENVAQGLGGRAVGRVLAAAGPRPRLGCRAVRQAAVAVPFPGKSFFVTVSSLQRFAPMHCPFLRLSSHHRQKPRRRRAEMLQALCMVRGGALPRGTAAPLTHPSQRKRAAPPRTRRSEKSDLIAGSLHCYTKPFRYKRAEALKGH
jgi:hypothetical protein